MTATDAPTHREGRGTRIVFWAFLLAAGFYLIAEHRTHTLGALRWLPLLILLACPLLHVGMHRGHRHHAARRDDASAHRHDDGRT